MRDHDEDPQQALLSPEALRRRYERLRSQRGAWEALWQDCYDYALPARRPNAVAGGNSGRVAERLFDATAADAAEQLAATLLAQLTPPWSRWFAFQPGRDVPEDQRGAMAGELDRAAELLQAQFDRSNFSVELHQSMLDLVVAGTACLACEEAPLGEASAFRFSAVPLNDLALEESGSGRLDTVFRRQELTLEQLGHRYPMLEQQAWFTARRQREPDARLGLLDCLLPAPAPRHGYLFATVLEDGALSEDARLLTAGRFDQAPFIAFRWLKAPGETYGRSPVMKALPDIKTANKTVEQMLLQPVSTEDARLDPDRIPLYGGELEVEHLSGDRMLLTIEGKRMVSASCWWDPAFGMPRHGDGSVIAAVFGDADGGYWLHRIQWLEQRPGSDMDAASQLCVQAASFVKALYLPSIRLETNGIGKFLPSLLRRALSQADCGAGVVECTSHKSKSARILQAFDVVLAAGALQAHRSVADTPFFAEMREWRPDGRSRDDGLDAVSGCLLSEPVRFGLLPVRPAVPDWRGAGGQHVAKSDFEV